MNKTFVWVVLFLAMAFCVSAVEKCNGVCHRVCDPVQTSGSASWTTCVDVCTPQYCTETCSPCGGGCDVTDMSHMFKGFWGYDAGSWQDDWFQNKVGDISGWDTSCVTNMAGMFEDTYFTSEQVDVSRWDVSHVTNMSMMFGSSWTDVFSNPDLSRWDTRSVTDMSGMFLNNQRFNGNIGSWNTQYVSDMHLMFANSIFNKNINSWNTINVKDMSGMFANDRFFNQPLNSWNVVSVRNMSRMFMNTPFNQPLNSWGTRSVKDMSYMFYGGFYVCYSMDDCTLVEYKTPFSQDISMWDKSSLISSSSMFGVSSPKWYESFYARDFITGATVGTPTLKSTHLNVLGWVLIVGVFLSLVVVSFVLSHKKRRHHHRR